MSQSPQRSIFVVVEGIDKSGKTSLVSGLEHALRDAGVDVTRIGYPNRKNTTGKIIHEVLSGALALKKEAVHLLFSANRWEDSENLEKILGQPKSAPAVVLCDRYILSGIAYSVANGLPMDFCLASDKGITLPDLVIFLDVSPEETKKRGGFGGEIYEEAEMQWRTYRAMKSLLPQHFAFSRTFPSASKEETLEEAFACIMECLLRPG